MSTVTKNEQVAAVPLLDLTAQYAAIQDEVNEAIHEVLAAQRFILGPRVEELEESIAHYCHCEFGVGASSGTDALLMALMALEIGPGDAVVTTPYSFFATAGSIARLGARPLFCDIEPDTFNLSAPSVQQTIELECELRDGALVHRPSGAVVKAIVPVHLFGQSVDMRPLNDLASRYGLRIVEDAAQAIGAEDRDGRRAGGMGDIGCFSFFPSKNLGAFGDGGMCTTNDPQLAERMRVLRAHGAKRKYHHQFVGGNFRLDAIQAAVVSIKLRRLDEWTARRQDNAAYYDEALGSIQQVVSPRLRSECRHVFNQYVVRVERRDELKAHLASRSIGTEIYYPLPLHRQECFQDFSASQGALPVAEQAAQETLALPIYPELTTDHLQYVADAVAEFYRQ